MNEDYTRGIAFIMEGTTEKVFYMSFLKWTARKMQCSFEKGKYLEKGDIYCVWDDGSEKILVKFNVVGAITQVSHSAKWFSSKCSREYKIPWKVFLCYDTDNSANDISKFYEDDWKLLRSDLKKAKAEEIIDLAARADIEDIMLMDVAGICRYLGIEVPDKLHGRKGKAKMKALFRSCGSTYHEGDKAKDMIEGLDFQKIVENSPLNLQCLMNLLESHNML